MAEILRSGGEELNIEVVGVGVAQTRCSDLGGKLIQVVDLGQQAERDSGPDYQNDKQSS